MAKEKEVIVPVKLAELQALADKYQITLNIRGMGNYKEVKVIRGRLKAYPWRKLILRLKATGFVYIEGQGEWFGMLNKTKKKWLLGRFREDSIPA